MSTPEGRVLRACLDYLRLNGIFAVRINVQGIPLHDQPGRFRPAPSKGIADIIGIGKVYVGPTDSTVVNMYAPFPLAVEVKSKVGRQSPAQRTFQGQWEKAGGVYIIARSVDELGAKLRAAGVETRVNTKS